MYIKDVTIEGFKSYAHRVHIPAFDPRFNAITGMNGTGKSNILDAICFVLGISNLSQVRAGSLLDLVYKKGQAGITEAVVCITFDNSDKARSPPGYEERDSITVTRQIVVGGRNKYRLSGRLVTPTQISEFFRSIGLNVNNPHFLIMQGRITQVLNMKPQEILSMLEEVSGTKMYEEKRIRAFQIFGKKNQKLKEFDEVMASDLKPTLTRLREERNRFLQYSKAKENLEALERFCVAYDFDSTEKKLAVSRQRLEELQTRKTEVEQETTSVEKRIKNLVNEIKRVDQMIDQQFGGERNALQAESDNLAKEVSKEEAKLQVMLKKRESLSTEIKGLEHQLSQLGDEGIQDRMLRVQQTFEFAKAEASEIESEIAETQLEISKFNTGSSQPSFLKEKLESKRIETLNLASKISETEITCSSLEDKLSEISRQGSERRMAMNRELEIAEKSIQSVDNGIKDLKFDDTHFNSLQASVREIQAKMCTAKDRIREISRAVGDLEVSFRDPYQGFDRSKVKGIIGSLFRIKQAEVSTALEVAGGPKLKHLVVDSVQTANEILKHGNLKRKITIIPLDKINPDVMSTTVRQMANDHFGDKAKPALDFIEYDPNYSGVMNYIFGRVFVCKDNETAKAMVYHPSIRTRCVTIDGNDYSPSGILTAGHRSSKAAILKPLHELNQEKEEFFRLKDGFDALKFRIDSQQGLHERHQALIREKEIHLQSVQEIKKRLEGEDNRTKDASSNVQANLQRAKQTIQDYESRLQRLKDSQAELETQLASFDGNAEHYLSTLHTRLGCLKQGNDQIKFKLQQAEDELQSIFARQQDVSSDRQSIKAKLDSNRSALSALQEDIRRQQTGTHEAQRQLEACQARLREHKAQSTHMDSQLRQMNLEKQSNEEKLRQCNSERRQMATFESKLQLEKAQFESRLQKLMKEHSWIEEERDQFGVAGTVYDWTQRNPGAATAQYSHAKATVRAAGQRADPNVISQFENAQKEYRHLYSKHRKVVKDRSNIEKAISDLDDKKGYSIKETWTRVNEEFGSIFGTLLPGANAKLEPPEGESYIDGLEIRVALGGIWKSSLSELSGGQRSLLALSLILSILRFKPAPFYILDEVSLPPYSDLTAVAQVDSALDLSHTQNIGQMIQRFFPQSQFVIVSLKEGMFGNANVLFRTKFSDGVSSVTRTIPDHRTA